MMRSPTVAVVIEVSSCVRVACLDDRHRPTASARAIRHGRPFPGPTERWHACAHASTSPRPRARVLDGARARAFGRAGPGQPAAAGHGRRGRQPAHRRRGRQARSASCTLSRTGRSARCGSSTSTAAPCASSSTASVMPARSRQAGSGETARVSVLRGPYRIVATATADATGASSATTRWVTVADRAVYPTAPELHHRRGRSGARRETSQAPSGRTARARPISISTSACAWRACSRAPAWRWPSRARPMPTSTSHPRTAPVTASSTRRRACGPA